MVDGDKMISKNVKPKEIGDSGELDLGRIIGILIIIAFFAWAYLSIFPYIRGPAADMNVNVKVDPTGNISQYSVVLQFADSMSYSKFLSDLKSNNIQSVNDYEFRTFSSSQLFTLDNDSKNQKISLNALTPFDPNKETSNIRITKNQDYWEFQDLSIINSTHLPEKYINKLTYSLTVPSKLIEANTLENSTVLLSNENVLTWHMDREKNPLNPLGENIASPIIFARFEVPEQNSFPIIPVAIGVVIAVLVMVFIIHRRD